MTQFLSSVPIIPARDVESSASWYRDSLGYEIFRAEDDYGIVGRGESWIHFFEPPPGSDPREELE